MWVVHIISEGICQYGQNNNVTIKCYYTNLLDASLATYFLQTKSTKQARETDTV